MKLKINFNIENIKKHAPYILILFILTLINLFYFFNVNLPAHDITTGYTPNAETLKISALQYKDFWPLWNPYGFSGTPFLMKPILGLDSLLGILLIIVPNTILALKLTYVFLFFLSGISMYSLAIYLKLDRRFAFISALVYLLNGHTLKLLAWGWLTTLGGYALLPIAFLVGIKAIKEKDWIKNSILAGIIFAILLRLNPDTKVTIWFGLLFGVYLIFNLSTHFSQKKLLKTIFVSLLIFAVFFGLSAQRTLPNTDYIKISSRGETHWEKASGRQLKYNVMFNRLIEPIYEEMPEIRRRGTGDHIGIVAFLLVLFAIYKKYKNKNVIFFSLGALLFIFITTNTFKLYYLLWRFVPFFKSLRYMDRSLFMFVFCSSILAGIGAKELFEKIKKHKKAAYFGLIGLIILNLGVFNYSNYTGGDPKTWVNANEAIQRNHILQNLSKTPGLFRIQTWETRGIDWGTDFYNTPLELEHIYRYDTMWYQPYMNVYLSVAYNDPAKFWGILNLKYLTSRTELNLSGFKFVKKFENCTVCWQNEDRYAKAWGPYLYENEQFLPRAYIVNNSVLVVGEENSVTQTTYTLMLNKNFNPNNTVIIRGKASINDYNPTELNKYSALFLTKGSIDQNSAFKLQQYVTSGGKLLPDVTKNKNSLSDNDINDLFDSFEGNLNPIYDKDILMHNFDEREIKLHGQKGFLVYSEKFSVFNGWNVIDQNKNKLPLLNADVMISSVYLRGDEENLKFVYRPKSYVLGSTITLLTLIILVLFILMYRKKN